LITLIELLIIGKTPKIISFKFFLLEIIMEKLLKGVKREFQDGLV